MLKHVMAYFAWNSNVINEYWINGKIEWYCGFKFFYHCQISPLFSLCMCLLLAVFLKVIFNQKEKRGFIWPKTFDFLFQKSILESIFFHKYRKKQLSILVKSLKNKHEHDLFHRFFSAFFLLFRNTYIKEHLWLAASKRSNYFLKRVLI